jgi:hypothetical protein
MLNTWTKILPFFIIEWYCKKNSERFTLNTKTPVFKKTGPNETFTNPYKGVLIEVES